MGGGGPSLMLRHLIPDMGLVHDAQRCCCRFIVVPQVGYMPTPKNKYTDDSLDLVVENLALSGCNLFPNIASLDVQLYEVLPYSSLKLKDEGRRRFTFTFARMQADTRM